MRKIDETSLIEPWVVQRVLIASVPPNVTNITEASKILAKEYGVSPETLRQYASLGVPKKSKIRKQIIRSYYDVEAKEERWSQEVLTAEQSLLSSIDNMVTAFERAAQSMRELKEALNEERAKR